MKYSSFIRKASVRPGKPIDDVPLLLNSELKLPTDSCLHYMDLSPAAYGIRGDHPFIVNFTGEIRLHHEKEMEVVEGRAKFKDPVTGGNINYRKLEQIYFKNQPRVKWAKDLDSALGQRRNLVVLDYSLLTIGSEYASNPMASYYEWVNLRKHFVGRINAIAESRRSFLAIQLPKILPDYQDFIKIKEELNPTTLKKWHAFEALDLRAIWLFMQGKGVLNDLSDNAVENTDLIITDSGTSVIMPLRYLLSEDGEWEERTGKRFIKLLEEFIENRSTVAATETAEAENITELEEDTTSTLSPAIEAKIKELGSFGLLTAAEQGRMRRLAEATAELPSPDGKGTLAERSVVTEEDVVVNTTVPNAVTNTANPELFESSMYNFDKDYIDKVADKEINSHVMKLKDAGFIITGFSKERKRTLRDDFYEYKLQVQPVSGKLSTISFKLPHLTHDGTYINNGSEYAVDTQRVDMPIRKTSSYEVSLTSLYGKCFIRRSQLATDNYSRWFIRELNKSFIDSTDVRITNVTYGKAEGNLDKLPLSYTEISSSVTAFSNGNFSFMFDYHKRADKYGADRVKAVETKGHVVCGKVGSDLITINPDGRLTRHLKNDEIKDLGLIHNYIWGDVKPPRNFAVMTVFGKQLPVGIVLAYLLGFEKSLKLLKVKFRLEATGSRIILADNELAIRFKDDTVVIDVSDPLASMILGGWRRVDKQTKHLRMDQFNTRAGFESLGERLKVSAWHYKETELMRDMFIDSISERILKRIKEPTKFIPLVIKACEYLLSSSSPEETDTDLQRFRGLERINGVLYTKLIEAVRTQRNNPMTKTSQLSMNPNAVFMEIVTDTATGIRNPINPMEDIKEKDAVSLSGNGGRAAVSLVKASRGYNVKDVGVISEGTPDSSKVGIRTFMSNNPNISTLDGMTTRYDGKDSNKLLSNVAMLFPGSNHDDAKRLTLAGAQASATVACKGYVVAPFRTGVEKTMGAKASSRWAMKAESKGVVKSVKDDHMVIEYADGTEHGIKLGVDHVMTSGACIPHTIASDMREGDTVKPGDIVAWNNDYFQRDEMNPRNVIMKMGIMADVAFMERSGTLEDGSYISPRMADLLSTPNSKRKTILVDFDKEIHNLVKVGQTVDIDDVLCYISDAGMSSDVGLSAASIAGLSRFGVNTPKAGFDGTVSRIEVSYAGEIENMSENLQAIAIAGDKLMAKESKALRRGFIANGKIEGSPFINGQKIEHNQMIVTVYMDGMLPAGVGDKGTVATQLKTIFGGIMPDGNRTVAGNPLDVIFGYKSVQARTVLSPMIQCAANTVLIGLSKQAAKIYKGDGK